MRRAFRPLLNRLTQLTHPTLSAGEWLVVRLLGLAWLMTGHVGLVAEPTTAWGEWSVQSRALWSAGWIAGQLSLTLWLVWGARPRLAAGALGALLCVGFWVSRPYHANNRLFFASLLLCTAATTVSARWRPMRLQSALLFLGAGLDKLANDSWRSGEFLGALTQHIARWGTLWAPGNTVGRVHPFGPWFESAPWALLSWCTIVFELAAGVLLLGAPRRVAWVVVPLMLSIAFLGASSMGMFVYLGLAVTLLDRVRLSAEGKASVELGKALVPAEWVVTVWAFCCGPWFHGWVLLLTVAAVGLLALAAHFPTLPRTPFAREKHKGDDRRQGGAHGT